MRNKSVLSLLEMLLMVLVLALASALCLRVFVYADTLSRTDEAKAGAQREAQNAAEILKAVKGDVDAACELVGGQKRDREWVRYFDQDWNPVAEAKEDGFCLYASCEKDGFLGRALIRVESGKETLTELKAAWQEDEP